MSEERSLSPSLGVETGHVNRGFEATSTSAGHSPPVHLSAAHSASDITSRDTQADACTVNNSAGSGSRPTNSAVDPNRSLSGKSSTISAPYHEPVSSTTLCSGGQVSSPQMTSSTSSSNCAHERSSGLPPLTTGSDSRGPPLREHSTAGGAGVPPSDPSACTPKRDPSRVTRGEPPQYTDWRKGDLQTEFTRRALNARPSVSGSGKRPSLKIGEDEFFTKSSTTTARLLAQALEKHDAFQTKGSQTPDWKSAPANVTPDSKRKKRANEHENPTGTRRKKQKTAEFDENDEIRLACILVGTDHLHDILMAERTCKRQKKIVNKEWVKVAKAMCKSQFEVPLPRRYFREGNDPEEVLTRVAALDSQASARKWAIAWKTNEGGANRVQGIGRRLLMKHWKGISMSYYVRRVWYFRLLK